MTRGQQQRARLLARSIGAGALALGLAGCALNADSVGSTLMADPLKYQYYDCKQLAATLTSLAAQEQKLRNLIVKAEQDTGGAIVATLAYKNDYMKVRADMKVLRDTQQSRDCLKQTGQDGVGRAR